MRASYDGRYVVLSVVLAVLSAYAALDLSARVQQSRAAGTRMIWLMCGALALGAGIWSMHYVGMLAFRLPVPVEYDALQVALSLLAAVGASWLALFLATRRSMNVVTTAIGSVCMGGGIAAMHYIGMAAMRTAAMPMYSTAVVALSVLLAVLVSFVALRATFANRHLTHAITARKVVLAALMGGAIPSVHYVGMAAATWHPMESTAASGHGVVFHLWSVLAVPAAACLLLALLVRLNATVDASFSEQLAQQRTSEERYRKILSAAFDAFIGISPAGRITDWNTQAESTFGWSAAEALGRAVDEVLRFPGESAASFSQFLDEHTRYEVEGRLEVLGMHKSGEEFAAEMALSVLEVDGGLLVAAFVHDVTERKRAAEEADAARQAAEAANRAKSEFLANMSHEIRTPLNGILGMNELVLDSELTLEQRECLETVRVSADLLLSVITDILDFSKIEAGRVEIERVQFDLRECVETTLKTLALRADEKGLELLCDIAVDVPEVVWGDPARLRQVLNNLVGNAIKFTARGEVAVRVERDERTAGLRFAVSDTGIGIAPEKLETVFDAFRQADSSTTRQFGGTGLGLTISKHLVERQDGRLWVESRLGVGSRFLFELPLEAGAASSEAPAGVVELRGVRALVIDDNRTNRRILEGLLGRWEMRATSVEDGASGLRALQAAAAAGVPYRLVLTDMHMPEMDGFMFVQELKKTPELEAPTVMMLSSGGQRGDSARCRELGIAAYLLKPVRQAELQGAIVRALGGVAEAAVPAVEARPVVMAANGVRVERADGLDILLAEDNEINRKLAVRMLERRGHRVTVAVNGREALEQIEARAAADAAFDVVLMDVQMPEMGGMEATLAVRAREDREARGQHQHIVAMTALVMRGDRERCLAARMDGYLSKPFRPEELSAVLEEAAALKRRRSPVVAMARAAVAVDMAALMARVEGDLALVAELVDVLREDGPVRLTGLREAVAAGDAAAVMQGAHGLKGALGLLGAEAAAAIAAELEAAGREGVLRDAARGVEALAVAVEEALRELEAWCNEQQAEVAA